MFPSKILALSTMREFLMGKNYFIDTIYDLQTFVYDMNRQLTQGMPLKN